ncbi:MAG: HNH endonuclease [Planctomycetes bacterium]|nr:HNH endonuclease [Planctomycetota bacterium]MBL7037330.1 HNH endonuclease [Pirellulaceae bacterium]
MPPDEGSSLRRKVELRAAGCCEYCQSQSWYSTQPFSLEHIKPRSRDGETVLDNLAFAYQGCNNHKYNKVEAPDPITGQFVPLFNPRKERWKKHFTWDDSYELIIGLTPVGRATIEALKLNRDELVNLRRLLFAAGEHPFRPPRLE